MDQLPFVSVRLNKSLGSAASGSTTGCHRYGGFRRYAVANLEVLAIGVTWTVEGGGELVKIHWPREEVVVVCGGGCFHLNGLFSASYS